MRRSRPVGLLVVAPLVFGCGDDPGTLASVARDSAGVRVVEVHGPRWEAGEGWEVSAEPTLRIGRVEGDSLYQLNELSYALRLDDGTLVVADGGDLRIRFYDAAGEFVRQVGRSGEGPGEFRRISGLGVAGDTLWTFDSRLDRFTYFTRTGRLIGTARLDSRVSASGPRRFADGSYAMTPGFSSSQLGPDPGRVLVRDTSAMVRVGADGALLDTIGVWPGMEIAAYPMSGGLRFGVPRWGRNRSYAVEGDRLHVGTQERWEIRTYTADGELRRIVRRLDAAPVPTTDLRSRRRAEDLASIDSLPADERDEARRDYESFFQEELFPETAAVHGAFLLDAAGNLWVAEPTLVDQTARTWTVFDPDGHLLGDVSMPAGVRPLEIGADYVLGRFTDELDVEYLVLHALRKPGDGER